MALNSVDPNNVRPEMPGMAGDDNLMMKPPQTPIPSPNSISTNELGINQQYKGLTQGHQGSTSTSNSGGDDVGSTILGTVAKTLPFILALSKGGPVGYAEGGAVDAPNEDMAMGYMVGALHQQKYGGTPDTLEQAAQEIKQMMGGQQDPEMQTPGFAAGGMSAQGPNDQLMSALGLADDPSQMGQGQQQSPQMPSQPQQGMMNNPAMGVPGQPPTAPQQAPMAPQGQSNIPQQNPAMRGFADGGPNMGMPPGQEQPPLSPGQAFQGDGEVKGPGGPTDDVIPAKLSNGEFVFSQPATAFFGVDKLIKMNEQGKAGFMNAKAQVDQNQPQSSGATMSSPSAPMQPPGMMVPPQQGMAQGGSATMRTKGSGFCGL